eukprot:CAMPEP_0172473076 /NCGR_PEP_ID=MMETSP1065-20121228/68671_1 /TAXON_ID=265537 /ORGANISM="Amphiprora paludosa, Strain CCMP125" /LENGTH=70 /DNA_ID=CAMNT_0013231245 /DNA_START=452 /DNA_END=664 /DNA_ORIENTATION=+
MIKHNPQREALESLFWFGRQAWEESSGDKQPAWVDRAKLQGLYKSNQKRIVLVLDPEQMEVNLRENPAKP